MVARFHFHESPIRETLLHEVSLNKVTTVETSRIKVRASTGNSAPVNFMHIKILKIQLLERSKKDRLQNSLIILSECKCSD